MRRRKQSALKKVFTWFTAIFTATGLFVMYTPVANYLARPLVVDSEEAAGAELAVVLGGGVYGTGVLSGATRERLLKGLLLYKDGRAERILFSGATIASTGRKVMKSVRGGGAGGDYSEGDAMYAVARGLGISAEDLAVDSRSTSTYENIINARSYMEAAGLETCLIVTSPTHMTRAALVAEKLGLECAPAPVEDYTGLRTSPVDRISLMSEVMWEYAALVLYWVNGYV